MGTPTTLQRVKIVKVIVALEVVRMVVHQRETNLASWWSAPQLLHAQPHMNVLRSTLVVASLIDVAQQEVTSKFFFLESV